MKSARSAYGVTLVEIMVGLLVLTVAFVGVSMVFSTISKGILVNKTKTIAVNLAQEKIESLKNLSYFRLLVTTSVAPQDDNFSDITMYFDNGTTRSYYPQETLRVGDLTFIRRSFVEYLKQEGNDLIGYPTITATNNDTGIKRVTVYVVWQEDGEWKKVELTNLRNNPDRAQLEYEFRGVVSSAISNVPLVNALVDTEQNPSYYSRTDSDGIYSFKVQPGSYTLRVTATGYFTEISTSFAVNYDQEGSLTTNFSMHKMLTATATGYAYLRNHLIITQVAPTYTQNGLDQEFVELYNPTTYSILIASQSVIGGTYDLWYVTVTFIDRHGFEPAADPDTASKYLLGNPGNPHTVFSAFRSTATGWETDYSSRSAIYVEPNSFFLIANVSTVAYGNNTLNRTADAYYRNTADGDRNVILNFLSGGIRVTGQGGHDYNGFTEWHDGFGWGSGGAATPPSLAREGGGYAQDASADVFFFRQQGHQFAGCHDHWVTQAVGTCFHPFRNSNTPYACTFDSDNNASSYHSAGDGDWYALTMTAAGIYDFSNALFNADISTPGTAGRSAQGASVSVNDDNSAVAYVQRTGSFTVTNIATGTWTLTVSTGLYTQVITTMVITPSLSTHVPNGVTIPRWYYSGAPVIALTSTTVYGYISGTVRDALQRGISGATVDVAGAGTVTTNSQGRYRVNVEPTADSVLVMASKTAYSTESDAVNGVTLGVETSGVDFILVSAGSYKGFITSNGLASGKIPGVSVVARDLSSATVVAQAISGADGFYYLNGIATGSYIISPQLESGENNVPGVIMADVTVTPQVGWSTFTIANAYGELAGLVGTGSSTSPVTTGVLVVASPVAIDTEYPPDVNEGIRNGGTIYYSVSSDASGRYNMPIRGGSSYYIYGWFTNSVSVNTSSTTKKTLSGAPFWIFPGETTTKDVVW